MGSAGTQKMIGLVKEKTGYGVSIIVDKDIQTHASMVSASTRSPMHVIRVNPTYEKYGDYLVAVQCAMLLIKWGDPNRIADFVVRNEKANLLINEYSEDIVKKGFSSDAATQYARMIVTGVLQQLNSIPIQMLSMDMVDNLCPDLKDLQEESVKNELREATRSFSKKIQKATPKSIFDKNASMNAAYAYKWSLISGNRSVLLPFKSLGYVNKGRKLADIYEEMEKPSSGSRKWVHAEKPGRATGKKRSG